MKIEGQLARPFEGDLHEKALDNLWVFEPKLDGKRVLVHVTDRTVRAYNRKGDETDIPDGVADQFNVKGFEGNWVFDGELVDGTYWIFDVLACPHGGSKTETSDLTDLTLGARRQFLEQVFERWQPGLCRLVPQEHVDAGKLRLVNRLREDGGEGVMLKHLPSLYRPGKRSHGWLKLKFTQTTDVFVTGLNRGGKEQAVDIGHFHHQSGELIDAGGLKIPAELVGKVNVGDVFEVRYLYATDAYKLYQPVFVRKRDDKSRDECTTVELKLSNKKVLA